MQLPIANIKSLVGMVSALDTMGNKRQLMVGDELYLDEVVSTNLDSSVIVQIPNGVLLTLEALQSIKLSADITPNLDFDLTGSVWRAELSNTLINSLLKISTPILSSILSDIEPVYDLPSFSTTRVSASASELIHLEEVVEQPLQRVDYLDRFLRFNQVEGGVIVYFSQHGDFTNSESLPLLADKTITLDAIGYTDSAELLSYLIESYHVSSET